MVEIPIEAHLRQEPPCEYFGPGRDKCGGCALQHLNLEAYQHYKASRLKEASTPLIAAQGTGRRRVEFKVQDGMLGFYAAESHQVIQIDHCLVLEPALSAEIPHLSILAKQMPITAIALCLSDSGIDAIFTAKEQGILQAFAGERNYARVSIKHEKNIKVLANVRPVIATFGEVEVELPPGAFLQATKAGQIAITAEVLQGLKGARKIIDLFSGIGTYSFPLSETAEVRAYEGSTEMIGALNEAAMKYQKQIKGFVQDLEARPLPPDQLNWADGIVINPPRNGAGPLSKQIALSHVKKMVMVSCNPASFERDKKILEKGGYQMIRAVPIDQFHYTPHLEIVAVFTK